MSFYYQDMKTVQILIKIIIAVFIIVMLVTFLFLVNLFFAIPITVATPDELRVFLSLIAPWA